MPLQVTGTLEYDVEAASEKEARVKADELACNEYFGNLNNIEWEIESPTEIVTI